MTAKQNLTVEAEIKAPAVELQDAIERVARAICAATNGPLEGGSWALLGEKSKERIRKEARAAIAALSVSGDMRWQPIESAPDCEEGIIVCDAAKPNPAVGVARYMEGRWRGAHTEWGFVSEAIWPEPTHWMPLPEPPNPSGQQEDRDGE